jgi:hypothetical protein
MLEIDRPKPATDLLREVNDQIRRLAAGLGDHVSGRFVCECDDPECLEPVVIPIREYDARRQSRTSQIVAHEVV